MPPPQQQSRRKSESGNARGRVAKRSCNACSRCRKQKIKCSGTQPCEACSKRDLFCEFDEREQKILVSRGYIIDLERKLARRERADNTDCSTPSSAGSATHHADRTTDGRPSPDRTVPDEPHVHMADHDDVSVRDEGSASGLAPDARRWSAQSSRPMTRLDPVASNLTNPLSTGPSTFMGAGNGRVFYLGTSSNWSFTRRALSMTHEHIHQTPIPTASLLFDGSAYDLQWDGHRTTSGPDTPALPTLDHTIYLINAVKFHCGQMFHLFDEESFMARVYDFYLDPSPYVAAVDPWYVHFLVILAFGKAFVGKRNPDKRPPGTDFFVKALQLLPEMSVLGREPLMSTEILCCIALYFQCLDFRHAAHNYIGQAMRMALGQGMHTDMPVQHLGHTQVERCRRAWWTVYVLDREMTSLMGLPQSINDDDLHPDLPTFSGSVQRTAALGMQIKLSRVIASINRGVYGFDGKLNSKFLLSTKAALADIADLADELRNSFPLHLDNPISGVSRTSAYLHLLYHQCVVLATRPLLFCFLKIRLESPNSSLDLQNTSQSVWNLTKMCVESAQQMVNVLHCVRAQGLLETFLPFDLESLSVSTVALQLARAVDSRLSENYTLWLHQAWSIFEEMVTDGNVVAEFQKAELQQLDEMLCLLPQQPQSRCLSRSPPFSAQQGGGALDRPPSQMPPTAASMPPTAAQTVDNGLLPSPISGILEGFSFDGGLTTAQIMDTANSIESGDTEWLSHTILEHSIW
ncbi:uncharacterized protein K452DRAFT_150693 [Aplosporella prunicola CBS 121167]|uniref:Zn(2)-C6 fungal-type domain-containing protein n=1 Tax=Aplosporella prunicola CBS 121167 TaxID=1176127 RepID=A0A6A6BN33_9PEZI|nr:uncharacterized protein K452DRAFT_150693 [Aplosporella prunicola CBS 121167]KAF2143961.1 hypothetical protein K452DRAFT_150693 [Aplosporella prunicola CBS 121167]